MKTWQKVSAATAAAMAVSVGAIGIANAGSDGEVVPAKTPSGSDSGSIERAPAPGYDKIVVDG